uniref:Hexosyltransferase n=1 Tax=Rhipicephalus appendiculatus TaxID=34631 RepID=A0A131YWG4_RHIAP
MACLFPNIAMTYGKNATLTLSILSVLFVVFLTTYVYKYYGYQIRTLSSWSRRDTDHVQLTYEYVTRTAKACESGRNRTSVLIGVVSSADHFQSRAAIRETWGGTAVKMGFLVVFLLGTPSDQEVQRNVLAEQNAYGDIIQGDFMDTYRNLTYKTVMLIRWARRNCVSVEFVLKIDDDMLLGVWDFAIVLNSLRTSQRSMWGYLYSGFPYVPVRDVKSKWYVSRLEYASDTYPDFLSGTGYLISGDVISALEEFTHDQGFFPLEDVYLTAILAERANVSRLSLEGFSSKHVPYNQPCSTPRVVTSHKWRPDELRRAWTLIVSRLDFDKCLGINKSQMVS